MRAAVSAAAVVLVFAAAGCSSDSQAGSAAPLTAPTVTVASVNGSGCPAGTVTTSVAPGGSTITAAYTAFTAKAGTGSTATEFRRNCQLNLQIVSPGQTYAVSSVTEHGAVSLPAGGTALQRTSYYLQGNSTGVPVDHTAAGPLSGAWDQVDATPFSVPCGTVKNLNVNVELRVASPGAATSLSLNGAGPGSTLNFAWTTCP